MFAKVKHIARQSANRNDLPKLQTQGPDRVCTVYSVVTVASYESHSLHIVL